MKHAVIFDVDGVMLDSEPHFAEGRKSIAQKYGLKRFSGNINGSGMLAYWKAVLEFNGNTALSPETLAKENFDFCLDAIVKNKLGETPGLTRLLDSIETKYSLAVGSSSVRRYIEFVLGYLGVREKFEVTVCGDEVKNAKPHPDIYKRAVELLHVRPEECFVIEDSDNGMTAAVNAGVDCLGLAVTDSGQKLDKCTRVFSSMRELQEYLMR